MRKCIFSTPANAPPYPFFLGEAARVAHMVLARVVAIPGATCSSVGSRDYDVSSWHYPDAVEYASLCVQTVDAANSEIICSYPIKLLPAFYRTLTSEIERHRGCIGAMFVFYCALYAYPPRLVGSQHVHLPSSLTGLATGRPRVLCLKLNI